MSRQLSDIQKQRINIAGKVGMTLRQAAEYAQVDQKTLLKYGFKGRGYLVKVKLNDLTRGMFQPGEQFKVEDLAVRVKKELDLKNDVDAKDLEDKLKWLTQCKVYSFDEQNKSYYMPQPM